MRMIRVLVSLLIALPAGTALAQQKPAAEAVTRSPRPGDVQKVFVLKYALPDRLASVLAVFPATLGASYVSQRATIAVSGAPAVVAAIEETIKRLDVPPPVGQSVELTGYLLECTPQDGKADTAPEELQDAVAQLKRAFRYKSCALTNTLFARGAGDSTFKSASTDKYKLTSIVEGRVQIDTSLTPSVVHIRGLNFRLEGLNSGFYGDVDIRDGQRVVVGKLGSLGTGEDRLLILTAKLVE